MSRGRSNIDLSPHPLPSFPCPPCLAGPSIDSLTRLEVRAMQDVDSDEAPESLLLQLSRPAAAVLWSVVRSTPVCKMAGELILSHLTAFGSGDASGTTHDRAMLMASITLLLPMRLLLLLLPMTPM